MRCIWQCNSKSEDLRIYLKRTAHLRNTHANIHTCDFLLTDRDVWRTCNQVRADVCRKGAFTDPLALKNAAWQCIRRDLKPTEYIVPWIVLCPLCPLSGIRNMFRKPCHITRLGHWFVLACVVDFKPENWPFHNNGSSTVVSLCHEQNAQVYIPVLILIVSPLLLRKSRCSPEKA